MCSRNGLLISLSSVYVFCGLGLLVLGTLGITEVVDEVPDVAGRTVRYMVLQFDEEPADVFDDDFDEYDVGYVILFVSGFVLFVMGSVTIIGVMFKSMCLLVVAFIIQMLVMVVALAVSVALPIWVWVKTEKDTDSDEKKMDTMVEYQETVLEKSNTSVLIEWVEVQTEYTCCGVHNASDWVEKGRTIPPSCCEEGLLDNQGFCHEEDAYAGCGDKIDDWLFDNVYLKCVICLVVGIVLSFVLIVTQILTCLTIRRKKGNKI